MQSKGKKNGGLEMKHNQDYCKQNNMKKRICVQIHNQYSMHPLSPTNAGLFDTCSDL